MDAAGELGVRLNKVMLRAAQEREPHLIPPTVFRAPETFVERGVGRACCRTGAVLNFYTMKVISVVSVVLAQAAALVRTIYVVRKELAVPGRLAL